MKKLHDFYFHKAKKESYSARSIYKLQNIQQKYHLFSKGNKVVDLGASPGSWTEYLVEILGPQGELWSIDLKDLSLGAKQKIAKSGIKHHLILQSIFDDLPEDLPPLDAVVSDMAPNTQGNRTVDCTRSLELATRAYEIAFKHLKTGGHFVVKIFHSEDAVKSVKIWEKNFKFSKLYRPPAVQKESKETFFVGQNLIR